MRFAEDLESVANAEDQFAAVGFVNDRAHDRGKAGNGAAAKVIAVSKSAGQNDRIEIIERSFLVPDVFGLQSIKPINRCDTILVAVGTGKLNDGKVHRKGV